jgi:ABC-type uncharacterized transport system permease subunit
MSPSGPLKDPSGTGQAASSRPLDADVPHRRQLAPLPDHHRHLRPRRHRCLGARQPHRLRRAGEPCRPQPASWSSGRAPRLCEARPVQLRHRRRRSPGLAGTIEFMGPNGRLSSGMLPTHGFTAILIALVANLSVLATAVVAVFFGGLASAGALPADLAGLPAAAIDIINAAIALFITARASKRLDRVLRWPEERFVMNDTIIAILRSGTPLIYVTLAGVIAQRAGIWNLGLEGLMIIGACATILGIGADRLADGGPPHRHRACVLASALLWFVIEKLRANPIIAGLGLTGLGLGGTALPSRRSSAARRRCTRRSAFPSSARTSAPSACCRCSSSCHALRRLRRVGSGAADALGPPAHRLRRAPLCARGVSAPTPRACGSYALCIGGVLCAHRRRGACRWARSSSSPMA